MIGNDIVDLNLAQIQSNWKRDRFLEKIFTLSEQELIVNAANPDNMVWNLWSRKEACYKIYNRLMGIRGFFPSRIQCHYDNENYGTVCIDDFVFHTKTEITNEYIYSVAITEKVSFEDIKILDASNSIIKENGIPFRINQGDNTIIPVSITHHGNFERIISL